MKGVDSRAGGVGGRTIATICSQFHKLRALVVRLRSLMVLSKSVGSNIYIYRLLEFVRCVIK